MQPNQVIPPPNPAQENPYDFILQTQHKPQKSFLPSGNSRKQRIFIVIGGILAIALLFLLVMGIISSRANAPTKAIEKVAQTQTEIIRVSTAGTSKARDTTTLAFAQTVASTMTSNQQQTVRYLKTQRVKLGAKELALGASSATDASLKNAERAGRYDDELLKVLEQSLASYKQELNSAYGQSNNLAQKKLLQTLYGQAVLLTKNQPTSS